MGIAKLIKDLTTWTTHTQKHWIEVQNDGENESKKAELDWRVLRSIGVRVTNLPIAGSSVIRYSQIPLDGQRFLVTISADIATSAPLTNADVNLPEGLRPKSTQEVSTYFVEGTFPNGDRAIREDRKLMAYLVVLGDDTTGVPGRVSIANQHNFPRTLSLTYISNPAPAGSK